MSDPLFVEFHVLRSYPPSNLNRDELGSPKSIVFGGERRVRVSSQCLKRTWRLSPFFTGEFAKELLGTRSALFPKEVFEKLGNGFDPGAQLGLAELFSAIGKRSGGAEAEADETSETPTSAEAGGESKTSQEAIAVEPTAHLLYLSKQEVEEIVAFARERTKELAACVKVTKGKKKVEGKKVDAERKALKKRLDEKCKRNAVDVALFGRFLTSDEFKACDAALQVAHALGTQKLDLEYDYFTAVDDLQPAGETGAGHLGETELCASVMYEYAVCDFPLLQENLGGDRTIAAKAMGAIASAMCRSIFQKAKRNGTAPHTPADYIEVVVRKDAPVSLANAFLKPVRSDKSGDVMDASITALRDQAKRYDAAYGSDGVERFCLCLRDDPKKAQFKSLGDLATAVRTRLQKS